MSDENATTQNNQPQFSIQKIYVKDISFETPNSPAVFKQEWKPAVNLDLNTNAEPIEDSSYEITLTITATVKNDDKTAYLIEVQQAGIFHIAGFDEKYLGGMLGSFCPNILFPYAREAVSDIVTRGGFPQMLLAPINFDALYQQHLQQQQQQAEEEQKH
jgi:preprotein translocase subunit SecB